MGLEVAAWAFVATTAASVHQQVQARKAQKEAAEVQRAQNAADAARERRQQIREERVRRARILQSSENSGTAWSSGESGAVGSLSTNLFTNLAVNEQKINTAQQISIFGQKAADAQSRSQIYQEFGRLSVSIFNG